MHISEKYFKTATFEEKMKMSLGKISEKQKRENREQVIYICKEFCGKCPSFEGVGEEYFAFYMEGKSTIILERKACLFGLCVITRMMDLRWEHYCINGSTMQLSKSEIKLSSTRT